MAIYDNVDSAENNMPQSGDLSSDIQRKANESPSNSEGLFTSNINIDATSSESPYQKTSKNHSNNFKEVNDRNLVESCENEIDLESKFPANSNNHKNIQPSENGESESTKVDNFATDLLSDSKQNDDSNTDVDTIYYSVVSTYEEPENNIILPESLIFIARGKEDALVTLNITPGVAVYGEKRISVEAPPGPDGNAVKVEYRVWNPFRSKCKLSLSFHAD